MQDSVNRFGYVTIAGRANVGKSTLLNRIIGQKLSITSRKPQTTRSRILGIKTTGNCQIVYCDTPGMQKKPGGIFNRYMNRQVQMSLADVDVIIHMVEAANWTELDEHVYTLVKRARAPAILAINKVDRLKHKGALLPYIEMARARSCYQHIVPISALTGINIEQLEKCITELLPSGKALFPDDQITDKNERYFAGEFLREKLIRCLGAELPYNLCVTIEEFKNTPGLIKIDATIWVEKHGQKKIVIGNEGAVLKNAGTLARRDMERLFGKKVLLNTWVRVKQNWTKDTRALKQFGYNR